MFGTATYIMETSKTTGHVRGVLTTLGTAEVQSPYRSEHLCCYSNLSEIIHLFHKVKSRAIRIGCDGLSAISRIENGKQITMEESNLDLLMAIRTLLCSFPIQIFFRYVKCHQNEILPTNQLDV